MAIFRGIGGAGETNNDATLNAVTEQAQDAAESATDAANSATAAANSATAAATSATNAASSESSVEANATAAASSASSATSSATTASTAATNAGTAQTAAETAQAAAEAAQTAAETAETNAETAESNAASSASSASTSATTATTQATTATTQATNAATSATAAAGSATTAASEASDAADSATAAASSATSASSSATTATTKASEASTSATNAASSATSAASSATSANSSEASALTYRNEASTFASNASTSETNAAASASSASTSATNAASSATAAQAAQTAAEAAQTAAEAAQEAIDGLYLGAQTSDPTLDNNGDPVTAGDWYYNTTTSTTRIYDGSSWNNGAVDTSSFALVGNNLSDLTSASTARTNLGLGTAATTASTDYATAAQGALADSAIQSADLATVATTGAYSDLSGAPTAVSSFTNDSGYITDYTVTEGDVTAHQAALSITESQISDLGSYITGNQTITLSGDVSGSGTTSIAVTVADDSHNHIISNVDGLQTALDGKQATGDYVVATGDTMTGNLSFGDNNKAIFGAGSDLQIYHDGSNSYIKEDGTGDLKILANEFKIRNVIDSQSNLECSPSGSIRLYYGGSEKLATTSSGIDVTGEVVADNLDIIDTTDAQARILQNGVGGSVGTATLTIHGNRTGTGGATSQIKFANTDGAASVTDTGTAYIKSWRTDTGVLSLGFETGGSERLRIDDGGNVGIGTSSPSTTLNVAGIIRSTRADYSKIQLENTTTASLWAIQNAGGNYTIENGTTPTERMRITSDGNVGIGTSSPSQALDVTGNIALTGDLTVSGGDITLGGTGRIQGIDTVSASTDAASKSYVDTAVAGASGGLWELIEDYDVNTGVAIKDFSWTAGDYVRVKLIISDFSPGSNIRDLFLYPLHTGATSRHTGIGNRYIQPNNGVTTYTSGTQWQIGDNLGNNTGEFFHAEVDVSISTSTSSESFGMLANVNYEDDSGVGVSSHIIGYATSNMGAVMDGLRVDCDSNFATGNFKLYGLPA